MTLVEEPWNSLHDRYTLQVVQAVVRISWPRFVQKATALAISRDGSSGGMVRSLVITKDKVPSRALAVCTKRAPTKPQLAIAYTHVTSVGLMVGSLVRRLDCWLGRAG